MFYVGYGGQSFLSVLINITFLKNDLLYTAAGRKKDRRNIC